MAFISPIPSITLDHVAVACEQQSDAWPTFARDLPANWIGGGGTAGFSSAQVSYANGMKVEILEPHMVEMNDFLRRFLDRNGPGPHHLTFKVKDIAGALQLAEAAGYRPVGVNLDLPWWKEAFLHPKDAPGVVVQLAESDDGGEWGDDAPPSWFPTPRVPALATLVHVGHAVADMDTGLRLFRDLLAGEVISEGRVDDDRFVDLAWSGAGRIRLLSGPSFVAWLDGRDGRVHHIGFSVAEPTGVPGAQQVGECVWEVAPDEVTGVRLLLAETPAPFADHPLGYMPMHGRTH